MTCHTDGSYEGDIYIDGKRITDSLQVHASIWDDPFFRGGGVSSGINGGRGGGGGGGGAGGTRPGPVPAPPPTPTPQPSSAGEACDNSPAAVQHAAQGVANRIPGASVGMENGRQVIHFAGNVAQTNRQLSAAGFYSGILAFNPFDHPNGKEFRTYGSPGFHFKVLYPDVVETFVGGRMGVRIDDSRPATATDLHIDCHNPVGAGTGDLIRHGIDFILR